MKILSKKRSLYVFALLPLLLLITSFDGKRPKKSYLGWIKIDAKLKGKIKYCNQKNYHIPYDSLNTLDKNISDTAMPKLVFAGTEKTLFDIHGNITEESRYGSKTIYTYNKEQQLLEEKMFNYKGIITSSIVYTYNEKNNLEEYKTYDSTNKLCYNVQAVYDKKDSLIKELYFNYLTNRYNICEYDYHKNGKKIVAKYSSSNGYLLSKTFKEIDDNTTTVENFYYGYKGKLLNKTFTRYNEKAFDIEYTSYNKESEGTTTTSLKLNTQGDIVESIVYSSAKNTTQKSTMQYVYDSHGNYTKKTTYNEAGKIINVSIREFEYYQ